MRAFFLAISIVSLLVTQSAKSQSCLTKDEKQLYDLIMAYRKSKKLASVPLSAKLTKVAKAHVQDLNKNYEKYGKCNFHSWSKKGDWSPCCYTDDHAQAACMWNKPKEIAGYEGNGFEIAFWSSAGANATDALRGWQSSSGHNAVMVNAGIWKDMNWKAVGIGLDGEYSVVWFGVELDNNAVEVCE